MNISFNIRLFLLSLCLLFGVVASEAATVKGRVVNSKSSEPVVGAVVTIVSTTLGAATNTQGAFAIKDVPTGQYTVRTFHVGAKPREVNIEIDSANQVIDLLVLLRITDHKIVRGCISEFEKYQTELADFIRQHPDSVKFEISELKVRSAGMYSSVLLTVENNTPSDLYLLKDYECAGQMYIDKFLDASSKKVKVTSILDCDVVPDDYFKHDYDDIIRIPSRQRAVVDSVTIWRYDLSHLPPGDYKLQLVYVFPKSQMTNEDVQFGLASPIPNEASIGENYCMVLRGRFESNWLPVHIK